VRICSSVAVFKRLTSHVFHPQGKAGRCRGWGGVCSTAASKEHGFLFFCHSTKTFRWTSARGCHCSFSRSVRSSSYFELTLLGFMLSTQHW